MAALASYHDALAALHQRFEDDGDGFRAVAGRSQAVDRLLQTLWSSQQSTDAPTLDAGTCLAALGGYGRGELFPYSDVDLLVCTERSTKGITAAARCVSQHLWDAGIKASLTVRSVSEVERYRAADPEGGLALLDLRFVAGDAATFAQLTQKVESRRSAREARALAAAAAQLTRERHARYGHTLFHLEPNVKDTPGGLRDAQVTRWLSRLQVDSNTEVPPPSAQTAEALRFVTALRVFLHLRHGRDDNTLDWHAQDEAAAAGVGTSPDGVKPSRAMEPSYWMRLYFRHARIVERTLEQALEHAGQQPRPPRTALRARAPARSGFLVEDGSVVLKQPRSDLDPAADPEIVLGAFGLISESAARLSPASEARIAASLPLLSAALEEGPLLWSRLRRILCGRFAGQALRSAHAFGLLDLVLPEFHGIDALVIRDAYHRYTVDEHTFVLLDALHALADPLPANASDWLRRLHSLLADLPHPELLYLAALLHDTGKGRAITDHARASAELAAEVTRRLELDAFDRQQVLALIELHLEMSHTLRRDIFDPETARSLAEKVGSSDLLRMLTLFTYADIAAVHPDALTPWKAENLWRLWMATENQLEHGTQIAPSPEEDEVEGRIRAIARAGRLDEAQRLALHSFLEGTPERYLRSRTPEQILEHMRLAHSAAPVEVLLGSSPALSEVTVVTRERPELFADLTGTLASWGMNIVSAEIFSNTHGVVIDTFRFTDPYRTLELNPEEHERLRSTLASVVAETSDHVGRLLRSRRRGQPSKPRRRIATLIEFDNMSPATSTLMQVIAQDAPGLLRTIGLVLTECGCSVEVALIDTEGEMAIDIFYLTRAGRKLDEADQLTLQQALVSRL